MAFLDGVSPKNNFRFKLKNHKVIKKILKRLMVLMSTVQSLVLYFKESDFLKIKEKIRPYFFTVIAFSAVYEKIVFHS